MEANNNDDLSGLRQKVATYTVIHGNELESIKEKLLGSSRQLCIIPIFGMGGIGKTTKAWDELKQVFPDQENGSRIIVTTRENNVADYVQQGSGSPLYMPLLSIDRSLELLISRVSGGTQSCPSTELEEIAKDIASKCNGLPLTINVIGGILSENKAPVHWEKVAKDVNLCLSGKKSEQLLDLLASSYSYLPDHLKPCFLYLGVFPEDFEIYVSTLTRLWVAEGFIKATESEYLEEVAERYMEELISNNIVLRGRINLDGRMKTCALHDLMRDLILREAEKDRFFYFDRQWNEVFLPCRSDRTLTRSCFQFDYNPVDYNLCHDRFEMLRVLYTQPPRYPRVIDLLELLPSMTLVHLRYLAAASIIVLMFLNVFLTYKR